MEIPFTYRDAYERHQKRLQENPRDAYSLIQLAHIYGFLKKKDEKFRLLQKAVKLVDEIPNLADEIDDPNFDPEEAYWFMGHYHAGQKHYAQAIKWLEKLRLRWPDSALAKNALYHLGNYHFQLKNYRKALHYFKMAHEEEPSDSTCSYLAYACTRLNRLEEALQWAKEAVKLAGQLKTKNAPKTQALRHAQLAEAHMRLKQYEEVKRAALRALELNPDNVLALSLLANYYAFSAEKDPEMAELMYLQIIEKQPKNLMALHNLGMVYQFDKGDFNKAIEYYQRALKAEPDYLTLRNLAIIYFQIKDEKNYEACIDRIVRDFPKEMKQDTLLQQTRKGGKGK